MKNIWNHHLVPHVGPWNPIAMVTRSPNGRNHLSASGVPLGVDQPSPQTMQESPSFLSWKDTPDSQLQNQLDPFFGGKLVTWKHNSLSPKWSISPPKKNSNACAGNFGVQEKVFRNFDADRKKNAQPRYEFCPKTVRNRMPSWLFQQAEDTVDGRNPANQLRLVIYHTTVLYTSQVTQVVSRISEPSTVCQDCRTEFSCIMF